MELAFQVAAAAIIGSILCTVLRRGAPGYAYLTSILLSVALIMACARLLSPVFTFLRSLQTLTGLAGALFTPVYKIIAIGALTQLAGGFCQDAGEQALARIVELCGMVLALYAALPLAETALELLQTMTGG
ncbi:MAG: SpoIIIAC/SpoIIIAD family protein [Oscillospiraceae bacterium]